MHIPISHSRRLVALALGALLLSTGLGWTEIAPVDQPDPSPLPAAEAESPLDRRLVYEHNARGGGGFALLAHRPNYFLPFAYTSKLSEEPYEGLEGEGLDKMEAKFQISFKTLMVRRAFFGQGDIYFAYTQAALWQLYNNERSSPFRDTNYEPEFFATFEADRDYGWIRHRFLSLGMAHQSNGREQPMSRSWNRIYASFLAERGNLVVMAKPWYRLPDSAAEDDNPDIDRYMGYGELRASYRVETQVLSAMVRCNLRPTDLKGALELAYSIEISHALRFYAQYFVGYGETLIDYNHRTHRLGVGIALSDWL